MGGPAANRAPGTPTPLGYLWSGTGWESEKLCLSPPLPSGDRAASKPSCYAPFTLSSLAGSEGGVVGGSPAALRLWWGARSEAKWTEHRAGSKGPRGVSCSLSTYYVQGRGETDKRSHPGVWSEAAGLRTPF